MTLRFLAAIWPWLVFPLVALWRTRGSRSLDEADPAPPHAAPRVAVVVPARDEAANIARCVRSILASAWPALEVIVVDDHSSDATAALARDAGAGDTRLRIIPAPALPDGWMGKQWACATGAAAAPDAEVLLFTDADTEHAPDLVTRAVRTLRAREAVLLSVIGRQELRTFWERVVQPHVFAVMAARYGSTERVTRARRADDKLANGQCLFVERAAYDALGGHAAVRASVSEDLMLAKRLFAAGGRVVLVLGTRQLATRMYDSLDALVRGWRKNVFAGGREAMPFGIVGRVLFPLLLLFPPVLSLLPPLLVLLGLAGLTDAFTLQWAGVATLLLAGWWALVYRRLGQPVGWALTYPLGAAVFGYIVVGAIARGSRVEWKGRAYRSA